MPHLEPLAVSGAILQLDALLGRPIRSCDGTITIERDVHLVQSVECAGDDTDAAVEQD